MYLTTLKVSFFLLQIKDFFFICIDLTLTLKLCFNFSEEYIRKIDDEYMYEEVPIEEYYENG